MEIVLQRAFQYCNVRRCTTVTLQAFLDTLVRSSHTLASKFPASLSECCCLSKLKPGPLKVMTQTNYKSQTKSPTVPTPFPIQLQAFHPELEVKQPSMYSERSRSESSEDVGKHPTLTLSTLQGFSCSSGLGSDFRCRLHCSGLVHLM